MNVELNGVHPNSLLGGVYPDPIIRAEFTGVKVEEFGTIYFALVAYAEQLEGQLHEVSNDARNDAKIEDKMFLHQSLSKVYAVLFEMTENFNETDKKNINKWSGVI